MPLRGFEPLVQLGTLEELLTGRPYEDIVADDRIIADADGGERLVMRVSQSLVRALASASSQDLSEVAVPWSQTEEFWGQADPAELAEDLHHLAGLATRATAAGHTVYCWVCV